MFFNIMLHLHFVIFNCRSSFKCLKENKKQLPFTGSIFSGGSILAVPGSRLDITFEIYSSGLSMREIRVAIGGTPSGKSDVGVVVRC